MRKRVIPAAGDVAAEAEGSWLDLESLVEVEVTSEDPDHPIESALIPGPGSGWRASGPGEQTLRLLFGQPQAIRRIRLEFVEPAVERTQEYVLRWSSDGGTSLHDVVRQRWNFSPGGSTSQVEEHQVELSGVTLLELSIIPEVSGGGVASLAALRLA